MFGRVGDYVIAVFSQWKGLFAFLPFILDVVLPMMWMGWESWASRHLPADRRRRFLSYAALGGFILANYLAFSNERSAKEQVISDLGIANARLISKGQEPASFRTLTAEQRERIKSAFQGYPAINPLLVISHGDDDSTNLAQEIRKVLSEANVKSIYAIGFLSNPKNNGFYVEIRHPTTPSPEAKLFIEAMKKTGFAFKMFDLDQGDASENICCGLFVGPPALP
jgi:hypothetical protein